MSSPFDVDGPPLQVHPGLVAVEVDDDEWVVVVVLVVVVVVVVVECVVDDEVEVVVLECDEVALDEVVERLDDVLVGLDDVDVLVCPEVVDMAPLDVTDVLTEPPVDVESLLERLPVLVPPEGELDPDECPALLLVPPCVEEPFDPWLLSLVVPALSVDSLPEPNSPSGVLELHPATTSAASGHETTREVRATIMRSSFPCVRRRPAYSRAAGIVGGLRSDARPQPSTAKAVSQGVLRSQRKCSKGRTKPR